MLPSSPLGMIAVIMLYSPAQSSKTLTHTAKTQNPRSRTFLCSTVAVNIEEAGMLKRWKFTGGKIQRTFMFTTNGKLRGSLAFLCKIFLTCQAFIIQPHLPHLGLCSLSSNDYPPQALCLVGYIR